MRCSRWRAGPIATEPKLRIPTRRGIADQAHGARSSTTEPTPSRAKDGGCVKPLKLSEDVLCATPRVDPDGPGGFCGAHELLGENHRLSQNVRRCSLNVSASSQNGAWPAPGIT